MSGRSIDMLECPRDAEFRDLAMISRPISRPRKVTFAAIEPQQARYEIEGGALAGAVGSDEADDLPGFHGKADIVHGHQTAEGLAHLLEREDQRASVRQLAAGQFLRHPRRTLPLGPSGSARAARARVPRGRSADRTPASPRTRSSRSCPVLPNSWGRMRWSMSFSSHDEARAPTIAPPHGPAHRCTAISRYSMPALIPNGVWLMARCMWA